MSGSYLLMASMDVDFEHDGVFNEIYDGEHVPNLLRVPGVARVARYESIPFEISLGGIVRAVPAGAPRYHAIYEINGPDILTSTAWAEAVERGRWPEEVRPFTSNRHHLLLRKTGAST